MTDTATAHRWVAHGWRIARIDESGTVRSPYIVDADGLDPSHLETPLDGVMQTACEHGHTTPTTACPCGVRWCATLPALIGFFLPTDQTLAICRGRVADMHNSIRPRFVGKEFRTSAFKLDGVYGLNSTGTELSKLAADRYNVPGGAMDDYLASGEIDFKFEQHIFLPLEQIAAHYGAQLPKAAA